MYFFKNIEKRDVMAKSLIQIRIQLEKLHTATRDKIL